MKTISALMFISIGAVSAVFGQTSAMTLDQITRLDVSERVNLYQMLQPKNLANPSDFIPALVAGIKDANVAVRSAAASNAAYSMIGLQQLEQHGQPMPVTVAEISSLQAALIKSLDDPSPEVSRPAATALIYSDAPNEPLAQMLSKKLSSETDNKARVDLAKEMALAGYNPEIVSTTLIASLDDPDRKLRESAAKAIAEVKPDGALPKLALRLGDQEMMRDFLVDAIAAYGSEAAYLLPTLEKMLADTTLGGTLPDRILAAIAAIKNPQPQAPDPAQIKPVSLTDGPTTTPPLPTPAQTPSASNVTAPVQQSKVTGASTTKAEKKSSSDFPIMPVAIVVAVILGIAIYVLRRKSP
jgi:hypothetical protein